MGSARAQCCLAEAISNSRRQSSARIRAGSLAQRHGHSFKRFPQAAVWNFRNPISRKDTFCSVRDGLRRTAILCLIAVVWALPAEGTVTQTAFLLPFLPADVTF